MTNVKLPETWKDWTLTELIGEGSFGTVYKAERRSGENVFFSAIKIIEIPRGQAELTHLMREMSGEDSAREYYRSMVEDYLKEIRTMDSLKGITNIVSIEDYYVEEKTDTVGWIIYIRMELLESFAAYYAEHGMDENEVIRFGMDICTALEYCEEAKIIHRDIKPENIFVSGHGDYKLGDFGVARKIDRTVGSFSAKGNLQFMAPEVFKGEHYGATADIYSLGLLLYKLRNKNRDPFVDLDKQIIYYKEREAALGKRMEGEKLPDPAEASPELAKVILKACAFAPEERYQSAKEFKSALWNAGKEKSAPGHKKEKTEEKEETEENGKWHIAAKIGITTACITAAVLILFAFVPSFRKLLTGQKQVTVTESQTEDFVLNAMEAETETSAAKPDTNIITETEERLETDSGTQTEKTVRANETKEIKETEKIKEAEEIKETVQEVETVQTEVNEQTEAAAQTEVTAQTDSVFHMTAAGLNDRGNNAYTLQDYESALRYYEQAADMGLTDAQFMLGNMYMYGEGTETDYEKALKYFRLAADGGDSDAISELGYMHEHGLGTEQDVEAAIDYYTKAAELGNAGALNNLGYIWQYGENGSVDLTKAKEYYEKAGELGNGLAWKNLGQMYQSGDFGVPDYQKASDCYLKAADCGEKANDLLEELHKRMQLTWVKDVPAFLTLAQEMVAGTSRFYFDEDELQNEWTRAHACVKEIRDLSVYAEYDPENSFYSIWAIYSQELYGLDTLLPVCEELGVFDAAEFGELASEGTVGNNALLTEDFDAYCGRREEAFRQEPRLKDYWEFINGEKMPEKVTVQADHLNIRKYPEDGEVTGQLSSGDSVFKIMDINDEWSMIASEYTIGYAASAYLETNE